MFEFDLAAEKRSSIAAENRANEKIRKLENLKSLQLLAKNKFENEKKILQFKLKTEKQPYEELEKKNILEKVQAEKLEAQKQIINSKLAADIQLTIAENEAKYKIRKLEMDVLFQHSEANKNEEEKNNLEAQLKNQFYCRNKISVVLSRK